MANTLNLGDGNWATKEDSLLAYNSENNNYKPLPFDFSRGSSATRVNKDGLIETVGGGEPRIDFKDNTKGALLLEPTRTNILLNSDNGSSYGVYGATKTLDEVISLDGTLNSFTLEGNGDVNQVWGGSSNKTLSAGDYTFSVFAKKGTNNFIQLFLSEFSGSSNGQAYFDLENGTTPSSFGRIENYGNGWYKCSVVGTVVGSDLTGRFGFRISYTSSNFFFPTANDAIGKNAYFYGFQAEQGSYATSYIPTSGEANGVTRLADSCSQTLPSPVFNSYPFSVFAEVDVVDTSTGYVFSLLKSTSSAEYFTIEYFSNVWHITARPNGSTERITSTTTVTKGTHKIVGVWESSSMKLYLNGSLIASGSNSQSFNIQVNSMLLGQLRISGDTGSRNTVRQTELYNNALTDEQAIALTTI